MICKETLKSPESESIQAPSLLSILSYSIWEQLRMCNQLLFAQFPICITSLTFKQNQTVYKKIFRKFYTSNITSN